MNCRWLVAPPQPQLAERLAADLGVSPLLAQCLINRRITAPKAGAAFLEPRLRDLTEPERLPNLTGAVDRLWQAREREERVVIFGDYDVDGVTATALLLEVLRALGWQVGHYLPNRLDEGYGLTRDAVTSCLAAQRTNLLLSVDCGSNADETIRWLAQSGVDVIVLDHHQVGSPAPPAVALVNPQLLGTDDAGAQDLCSAGLAFKLAHAMVKRGRKAGWPAATAFDLRSLLDLVALGTIADLVPLLAENRILVSAGLKRLNDSERPGLQALKAVAQIRDAVGPHEVAFQIAPRLNAAGRIENAADALEVLLTRDSNQAVALAQSLHERNAERQNIERGIAQEVISHLRPRFDPRTDFVLLEGQLVWHVGVVGIVASRVLQEFHRPAIILGGDGHDWRGSGRSIEGFDLAAALRSCDDILVRHGGHAMAAGLTVHPENVPALRRRLNALAAKALTPQQLQRQLHLDAQVALADLTLERLQEFGRLQPVGQGNPPVQMAMRGLSLRRPPQRMGRDQQHVKLAVTDGEATGEAVWWGGGNRTWPEGKFDLACAPQINEFNGRASVQLKVLDWQPCR